MPPGIATTVYALLILGLFWLDRDRKVRTSGALWIPVIWVSIACSRSVAQWLLLSAPLESPDQLLEGNPIDRLVYTVLMAVGLIVLFNRRRQVGRLLRANGPILLFFLYCALSLLWSDYPDVAFKRWTKALGDMVMVLVVLSDREPYIALKRLLARSAYILIPSSILLIKYFPNLARAYDKWDGLTHYLGVTTNKNTLGAICLLFGLGSAWRFLAAYQDKGSTGRIRLLIAHGAILAMVLWLFQITNSMTSLSCFLLGSGLLLAMNYRSVVGRPAVLQILVLVVILVCASVLFLGLDPSILAAMGRSPTLTDRTEVWHLLLSVAGNPLFGTGFESFWLGPRLQKVWSVYSWQPLEAHNGYIEVFLNLGWTGVLLLAIVIATAYRTVMVAWRRNSPMASLCLAYFVVGVIYNFTEAAFFRMMTPVWIFFLLAITRLPELPHSNVPTSEQESLQHQYLADLPANRGNVSEEIV
jgi:exopolysaccharide production protein ExoQ